MSSAMDVMLHSSSFLLPSDETPGGKRYALVVLNQNLPRFTPLLWEHVQQKFVSVLMAALIASTTNYLSSSLMKTLPPFVTGISRMLSREIWILFVLMSSTFISPWEPRS